MKEYIDKHFDEYLKDLKELVSYNSVLCDDEKPFGSQNRKVLDAALKIMEEKGLKTTNVDYYCGFGEVGEGEELIGIIGHLDIVPVGDGWDYNPLDVSEKDGYLYGRGVADDKGPALAALYALKYLIDTGYKFKKRVRLIYGCNEETGSRCIKYYVDKYGHVDMGFTPDGSFPGIYGEKGMLGGRIEITNSKVKEISGGDAENIVCKKVICKLEKDAYDKELLKTFFEKHNIKYESKVGNDLEELIVYGVPAHASTPELGKNAISYLLEGLYEAKFNDVLSDFFHECFGLGHYGEKLGFKEIEDELSNTTFNFGVIESNKDNICLHFDIRFAVKSNVAKVKELMEKVNRKDVKLSEAHGIEPLFFDRNTPFIKALKKAYEDVTGDKENEMEVIGGGTYAKAINNCIAFGATFPGSLDPRMHGANETVSIEDIKKQILVYIEAIKNLNEV